MRIKDEVLETDGIVSSFYLGKHGGDQMKNQLPTETIPNLEQAIFETRNALISLDSAVQNMDRAVRQYDLVNNGVVMRRKINNQRDQLQSRLNDTRRSLENLVKFVYPQVKQ